MLPCCDYKQAEPLPLHKTRAKFTSDYINRKINPLCVLRIYVGAAHPCAWLIIAILSLQFLLLLSLRFLPVSLAPRRFSLPTEASVGSANSTCDYGRVYVYDLPVIFNKELVDDCESLNPWHSRCEALSNDGFGRPAADRLKDLVPGDLKQAWFWTDQFAAEIIYHNRMLGHRCRTVDPNAATAFYVPFYGGLAVGKYLWSNYSAKKRDFHCEMLLRWIQDQEAWKRSSGWDHFMMLGRITWDFRRSENEDWGSSFLYMPGMKNVTRLLIERNPWDDSDVGVPYPTGFHPRTAADLRSWQSYVLNRTRTTLFCFAGATRSAFKDDFRSALLQQCASAGGACRSLDCSESRCSNESSATLELFLDSEFCLQPRGDSFTRRSIFDCMIAGSIPVFFWRRSAYLQYGWHLPDDPAAYSVFIDRALVKNGASIKAVMERLGKEKIRKMREKIVEFIPKFVYASPKEGLDGVEDALDVTVDGVLRRFQQRKREL
ncbi:xyloglucan galactosyltransferase XLT2-like [Aristolochia californica]|uniref:xyloglucan galactosyltransferase XLT2-like n=1 Tax=Aristolochia californica TaxID=171875 RepID=UPI0035DC41A5